MKKIQISRLILIILILANSFFAYSILDIQTNYNNEKLSVLANQTDKQITSILLNLSNSVDIIEQIAIAGYDNGSDDTLDAIFEPLIEDYGYKNVTILPDGIADYVYPIEGNEDIIGDNIFEIPGRAIEANLAYEQREVIVSGPYELTQGGEAFIARKAVFIDNEFWGFVAVVVDKSMLLDKINIAAFANSAYKYHFSSTVNNLDTKVISESENFNPDNSQWVTIELPNGYWSFGIEQKSNILLYTVVIAILLVGYFLSFLVSRYIKKIENNLKIANKEIYLDKLTGVNNRKLLDRLQNDFSINNIDYTVVYIDLNDFKPINDTYGHDVGDEVLITFSNKLQAIIRDTDFIIRMGGDEFLIILPKTITEAGISTFCQRLNDIKVTPIVIGNVNLKINFSFGYAISNVDGGSLTEVIEKADNKMYISKRESKKTKASNTR